MFHLRSDLLVVYRFRVLSYHLVLRWSYFCKDITAADSELLRALRPDKIQHTALSEDIPT